MQCEWGDKIFTVTNTGFEELALAVFRFQFKENAVYRQFAEMLGKTPGKVNSPDQVPFLPIRFFKTQPVCTGNFVPEIIFQSSGTTGMERSSHGVKDAGIYRTSFLKTFELFYGKPEEWCILGLLPSYLEQGSSSLVYMVDELIRESKDPSGGFYLYDHDTLSAVISRNESGGKKTLLIGVTYALLDFAESHGMPLQHTTIMETGGMKGRKKELTRPEVHTILKNSFGTDAIHSEYGMTELLSQAYSGGGGRFHTPPWMRVNIRDDEDPLTVTNKGNGLINITDLANVYSCSFIATDDVGKINPDGSFEVMGRADHSDLRGCSLMAAV